MAMTRRELRALRVDDGGDVEPYPVESRATVLFVCTGNVVRSPFLAGLLASLGLPELSFQSAGLRAVEGVPASGRVQELAQEYGIDLSHHSAHRLEEHAIGSATAVVCATREHKRDVLRLSPAALNHVFTIAELSRAAEKVDVEDLPDSPFVRWEALVQHAAMHRRNDDSDDIPDPYRRGDSDWWAFETAALSAALPIMRHLVGAA